MADAIVVDDAHKIAEKFGIRSTDAITQEPGVFAGARGVADLASIYVRFWDSSAVPVLSSRVADQSDLSSPREATGLRSQTFPNRT